MDHEDHFKPNTFWSLILLAFHVCLPLPSSTQPNSPSKQLLLECQELMLKGAIVAHKVIAGFLRSFFQDLTPEKQL